MVVGGEDGFALRGFGACAPAAALRLKVAQAAFSERAPWVVRAGAERLCEFVFLASSPQPAFARVAARGQPSGHLASGGGADRREEAAEGRSAGGGAEEEGKSIRRDGRVIFLAVGAVAQRRSGNV